MSGQCQVCDAKVSLSDQIEVSEVVNCSDCGSRLVVESINDNTAVLAQAPDVEEDWGE